MPDPASDFFFTDSFRGSLPSFCPAAIVNVDEAEIATPPKEGVYVKSMYLEGGGWDFANGCLCEPEPMELIVPMPILHFKPTEGKRKARAPLAVQLSLLSAVKARAPSRPRLGATVTILLAQGAR